MKCALASILFVASAFGGVISGTVQPPGAGSVVYVNAISGKTFHAPAKSAQMNQKNHLFQPHVLAVQAGTTVDFLNSDRSRHNIFWESVGGNTKLSHNLGTWPYGEQRPFKFDTPGVVPLGCNVHPDMAGFIVVTPTPYFGITDDAGVYKIVVPDGEYTVSAWREGLKVRSKPVTVTGSAKLSFILTK